MTFAARRWLALVLTSIAAVAIWISLARLGQQLGDVAYASGWLLLALVAFLSLYNLRKKLTYPPLLRSAVWLQLHAYTGVLSLLVFLIHSGFRVPDGLLELTLWVLFLAVALGGVVGILLSRMIPPRLAVRGHEVIYERIPLFRRQLRERAEALVVECVEQTGATTLADLYRDDLADYFAGPRHQARQLAQSRRPLRRLQDRLAALDRYLGAKEREFATELGELIEIKDALDYHQAMQGALKGWLFVHIPLTYGMLLLVLLHVVLVHAFRAGA